MSGRYTPAKATKAQPCPDCPWRLDSVGTHSPEIVGMLRPCATDGEPQGCHTTRSRLCAGFLEKVGRSRADVAFPAVLVGVELSRLRSAVPLFGSYEEMFRAHGVTQPNSI